MGNTDPGQIKGSIDMGPQTQKTKGTKISWLNQKKESAIQKSRDIKTKGAWAVKNPKKAAIAGASKTKGYSKQKISAIQKKAYTNLSQARTRYVQANGWKSLFMPKFWLLNISSITLSNPFKVFVVFLIAGLILMSYFFGMISLIYLVYFLKALVVSLINVVFSILNAIWFGFNGITALINNAFVTMINSIAYYFLEPILDVLNSIITWIPVIGPPNPPLTWESIKLEQEIVLIPTHAFSYWMPEAVVPGDWGSLLSITPVTPGANPYLANEFVEVYTQTGASVLLPKLDPAATAEGIWTSIDSKVVQDSWARSMMPWTDTFGSLFNVLSAQSVSVWALENFLPWLVSLLNWNLIW